ncbi:MAG: hypothetical protein IPJ88_04700 [Myxococcales bacterium]|nr:MAG: hypothetical protein IPJ88_04700 [Myxococcales bacterium]
MKKDLPNRMLLIRAAEALGDLVHEVVFVGGTLVDLFLTDKAAPPVRQTDDIDVVVEITTRADYYNVLYPKLKEHGFHEYQDPENKAPLCAWTKNGMRFDIMPMSEKCPWVYQPMVPKRAEPRRNANSRYAFNPHGHGATFHCHKTRSLRFKRQQRFLREPRYRGHHCRHRRQGESWLKNWSVASTMKRSVS